MRTNTCVTCCYFEPAANTPKGVDPVGGTCHRYAPAPICHATEYWPAVMADGWCGEWKAHEVSEQQDIFDSHPVGVESHAKQ